MLGLLIAVLIYTSGLVYFIADEIEESHEIGIPWRFQWWALLWPFTAWVTSFAIIWKAARR